MKTASEFQGFASMPTNTELRWQCNFLS